MLPAMEHSFHFTDVIEAAGLYEQGAIWSAAWPDSQASFRINDLYFFQPHWIEESLAKLHMPETINAAFRKSQPFFAQNPALQRLAWHCHHSMTQPGFDPATLSAWPLLPPSLGPDAAMFYAFVCLAGLPQLERLHRQRGIDPSITYDTLADFALWMEHYHRQHGVWGLSNTILGWVNGYLGDRLIKLGRLQYSHPSTFPYDFHVYRNRHDRRILTLAGDGMQFRPDGQFDGANKISAGNQSWTSRWTVTSSEIKGQVITRMGEAQPATVILAAGEWEEILNSTSQVRAVHIPACGPLSHSACQESLRQACTFLPAHYPETSFCAFTCVSWLMDNQFARYLPETSNILQFQRNFHLHPIPNASDEQTYERVFGRTDADIETAPKTTSLQRLLAAHVKANGRWHNGGGFILLDRDGMLS